MLESILSSLKEQPERISSLDPKGKRLIRQCCPAAAGSSPAAGRRDQGRLRWSCHAKSCTSSRNPVMLLAFGWRRNGSSSALQMSIGGIGLTESLFLLSAAKAKPDVPHQFAFTPPMKQSQCCSTWRWHSPANRLYLDLHGYRWEADVGDGAEWSQGL